MVSLRTILREPLVHFILAGAAIFGIYTVVHKPAPPDPADRKIRITQGDIEQLRRGWLSQWQRPPTPAELQDLVANRVKEEVLSREALQLGLDRDDLIVRRRLAQKFEFLSQDLLAVREPTDADLTAFLAEHTDRFQVRTLLNFSQVYLSQDRGRKAPEEDAKNVLDQLRAGADPATLGDPSILESEVHNRAEDEVSRQFGGSFAAGVVQLEPGVWSGPLRSVYGWHLVKAAPRSPGRLPALAEIRSAVAKDWTDEQRRQANEDLLRRLRGRYDITIETIPLPAEAHR